LFSISQGAAVGLMLCCPYRALLHLLIFIPSRCCWVDAMLPLRDVVVSVSVLAEGHIYPNPTATPWDGQSPTCRMASAPCKGSINLHTLA